MANSILPPPTHSDAFRASQGLIAGVAPLSSMTDSTEMDILAARIRLRIAYIASGLEDFSGLEGVRRVLLTPRLTVYVHLYSQPEASLLDVETNSTSLDGILAEHTAHSSVVREFNLANGTNVRLRQGESVICRGDDELVSMKLTPEDIVTYMDQTASHELLAKTVRILDDLVQEGLLRCARILHSTPRAPLPR